MFSLMIPLSLTCLSVARLVFVKYPFQTTFKRKQTITIHLGIAQFIISLFSIAMSLSMKNTGLIPSNLCSPFIDPIDSVLSTKITTWSVAMSQAVALSLRSVIYCYLLKYLKEYYQKNMASLKSIVSRSMILQLLIITASNLLCWFPSNIIYLSTLFYHSILLFY